ncbi:MAG: SMC family ATPase [Herpetosiphonaceae bacterium]|nr:SMC family ATPase [Herpetosiphonaceae bacterium]
MIPYKLTVRNFMCYREDVPPLLFEGIHIACLSGENGAGKSTLLDAITWALWGEARGKSDDDLIALGSNDMEVDFEWQLEGAFYRVIRRRTKGKRTGLSIVELQVQTADGSWRRLSGDSVRDTNAQISELLRMSYATFINSAFLMQGRADEFTNSTPQARKQVLGDMLGLADYERLEKQAKQRRDRAELHLREREGVIADYEQKAQHLPLIKADMAAAEVRVTAAQQVVNATEAQAAALREHMQQLRQIAERQATVQAQLTDCEQRLAELELALTQLQTRVTAHHTVVAQSGTILAQYETLQNQQLSLHAMDQRRDQAMELRELWHEQRDIVSAAKAAIDAELSKAQHELTLLEEQTEGQQDYEQQVTSLQAETTRFAALQTEHEHVRQMEASLAEQLSAGDQLALEQSQYERIIDQARGEIEKVLHSLEQTIERCQPQVERVTTIEASLASIEAQLVTFDDQAATMNALQTNVAELEREEARLQEQMQTITKQGKETKSKLDLVQAGSGICPVCHSELGAAGLQTVVDQYTEQQTTLRAELRAVKRRQEDALTQVTAHRSTIATLEAALQKRSTVERKQATTLLQREQAESARNELLTAQAELTIYNQRLEHRSYAEAAQAHLQTIQQRIAALGDLQAMRQQREQLRTIIREHERELSAAPQAERRLAEAEVQLRACRLAAQRLPTARKLVDQLQGRLDNEDYAQEARSKRNTIRQQYDALAYSKDEHAILKADVERLLPAERRKQELERAITDLERDEQQLGRDTELLAYHNLQITTDRAELAELMLRLREQREVEFGLREAEASLERTRETLANAQKELGSIEGDLRHCNEMIEQLQIYRQQATRFAEEHALFAELTEAFGKKGLQAMLIENALPEIEHEANQLLARITDHQMHVTLDTQRDTKKGDTIETLDIRIADGLGTRDYAMYSGGEAFRVNFAVRIALSKLLAHRAGASLKTLVIDEGFGTQDGKGRERVIEAINAVADDFARVLVITHIQELKDQFPTQIEITKGSYGSTWRIT